MATWLEKILAATDKIEDKELKDLIRTISKEGSQESGKALSDLNKLKSESELASQELATLKDSKASYEELMTTMAKAGVEAGDAEALLAKLKVEKTAEDENNLLKKQNKELLDFKKQSEQKEEFNTRKSVLSDKVAEAIKEYKDKDGNEYPLVKDFIDEKELYKPIDVASEALVNDRITQALSNAHNKQEQWKIKTGMDVVTKVPKTPGDNSGHFGKQGINNEGKIFDKYKESGRGIDDAARTIMNLNALNNKE